MKGIEQAFFSVTLDQLEPIFKSWVKDVIHESKEEKASVESEERMSREELAKYLNASVPTIDRYKANGVFPYYQTGRKIYFKKSEVDEALRVGINKKHRR